MLHRLHTVIPRQSGWPQPVLTLFVFCMGFYGYLWGADYAGSFEAEPFRPMWLELLLALYLYGLCFFLLRPSTWRWSLAALPLLLLYLVSDIFFFAFGKVFRLVNVQELPELLSVLPWHLSLSLLLVLLLPALLLFTQLKRSVQRTTLLAISPVLLILVLFYVSPVSVAQALGSAGTVPVKYSDAKSVEQNGRLTMLLYNASLRLKALEELAPYRDRERYDAQVRQRMESLQPQLEKRNVHLIVLESFLDPRLFSRLSFSTPPVHPDFQALFGEQLGLSRASVFGGATAQAEFELLCGVPALERLSSVEFNVFTGSAANCLPAKLAMLGYQGSATNSYKPNFFNAEAGYRGAGFTVSHFPREFAAASQSYLEYGVPGFEEYLFDSNLFEQNLAYVEKQLQQNPQTPLFNYVLTIYGHTPHLLDPQKRPEFIELVSDYPDDHLTRSANQFYYRTQAIAAYARALIKLDPDSLIIFVSDHVPPLRNGPNTYKALSYLDDIEGAYFYNRLAVLYRGKPVNWATINHFDVPAMVLDTLSNGHYCQQVECKHGKVDEEAYLRLMAHASE